MKESTSRRDGMFFWISNSQNTLVELGSLVVPSLSTLTDGLSDISSTEITHVSVLSALL
jgi:hypothetical protein